MIALLIAALLAQAQAQAQTQAPDAADAFGRRMRDSAAAAQSLQGPLDGHWTLLEANGRALYEIQIADPPQGSAPPQGAWQSVADKTIGQLDTVNLSGGHLAMAFVHRTEPVRLQLGRRGPGLWRGLMVSARGKAVVSLARDRGAAFTTP